MSLEQLRPAIVGDPVDPRCGGRSAEKPDRREGPQDVAQGSQGKVCIFGGIQGVFPRLAKSKRVGTAVVLEVLVRNEYFHV